MYSFDLFCPVLHDRNGTLVSITIIAVLKLITFKRDFDDESASEDLLEEVTHCAVRRLLRSSLSAMSLTR